MKTMKVTKPKNKILVHETPEKCKVEEHHFIARDLKEKIEKKAYELYQAGGCVQGRDVEDWLEAEKMFKKGKNHECATHG